MDILKGLDLEHENLGGCGKSGWLQGDSTAAFESINPTTAEPIANIIPATANDYQQIMAESLETFYQWRQVPAPERGACVRLIAEKLREKKEFLGSLVTLEMGKPKQEGNGEVQEMIDIADFAVGQSRMLYGNTMHSERIQHRMYEQWHPLGPVGVISAFNFPVAVWAWNAFIAAICGDTVIWKPSAKTALCAIAVQKICESVMKDCGYPGVFSLVIEGAHDIVDLMPKDHRLPLISFTGSTRIGRKIASTVADRLGRSLLELSGNNALIIDETADLKLVIPAVVFGAVGTSGQRCTSTRRLFVHESIYNTVVEKLIHAYKQVRVGDPLDANVLMGPLVDKKALDAFIHCLEKVEKEGGRTLYGGGILDRTGYFVEPTIVEAENHFEMVKTETFAPILYVMKYKNIDQAIAMQNDVV